MRPGDPNIDMLELMAAKLGDLIEQLVFVGGSTTGLFITDALLPPVRATRDVDVITEASSRQDYHQLEETLRTLGFSPDMRPEAPICRWQIGDLILDLMPTDENILGFANRWYHDALSAAESTRLPSGRIIRTLTPPHFLATKLEAFHGRGNSDYWASHDMEDIVCVIDGRGEIVAEVAASNQALQHYLQAELAALYADPMFAEAVSGFLPGDAISQTRAPRILQRIASLAGISL
jgi:predicted nucleotidyltransferase